MIIFQSFNSIIAVVILGVSLAVLWSTRNWIGWLFAGMVTVAAALALSGFCIGCVKSNPYLMLTVRLLMRAVF